MSVRRQVGVTACSSTINSSLICGATSRLGDVCGGAREVRIAGR